MNEQNNMNFQNFNYVNNQNGVNNMQNMQNMQMYNQTQPQNTNYFGVAPKKNNKKIFLIIIAVAILLIGVGVFIYFKSKDVVLEGVNLSYVFDPNKPIPIRKNDYYGFIDSQGKVLLPTKYLYATEFYGDYALVRVRNQNSDDVYQIIDREGNVKLQSEYEPEYYISEDIWIVDGVLYDKNIKQITNNNVIVSYDKNGYLRWLNYSAKSSGIMTTDGKVTYTYNSKGNESYLSLTVSDDEGVLKENYCRISIENEKYAIVNCKTGKMIYNFTTNHISVDSGNIFEVSNHDTFETLYYLYIQNDKVVYKSKGSDAYLYFNDSEGYISVYDLIGSEYEYRYLDINTQKLVSNRSEVTFDEVSDYDKMKQDYGYVVFSAGNSVGLLYNDKVAIKGDYDEIDFVNKNLFNYIKQKNNQHLGYVETDDKISIMDFNANKTLATYSDADIYDYDNSTFIKIVLYDEDYYKKGYVIYNVLTKQSKNFDKDDDFEIYSNYVTHEKNNKTIYYNTEFKQIYVEN